MVIAASNILIPTPKDSIPRVVETDVEADICLNVEHFHELNFAVAEESKMLIRMESLQKEKQISVDPISLRESSRREASFNMMLPPIAMAPDLPVPPPLPPVKAGRHISCSLPNSTTSSPRFSFTLLKKKWKNESQASPRQIENLTRRHSTAHSNLNLQEIHLRRSKSCAEGRSSAPADELDLLFSNVSAIKLANSPESSPKSELKRDAVSHKMDKKIDPVDEGFKCGALCLYIPGFGRGKLVRSKREEEEEEVVEAETTKNVISRTVSLEKFECGSWASSAVLNDPDDSDSSMNLFFDLPLELIKRAANETNSPVSSAFVFDKERKGVLKNGCSTRGTSSCRKSHESGRHVRFSTSSPTSRPTSPASCITPRLRKAREDFNAFLEAQSA